MKQASNARTITIAAAAVALIAVLLGAWFALHAEDQETLALEGPATPAAPAPERAAPVLQEVEKRARAAAPTPPALAENEPRIDSKPATVVAPAHTHGIALDLEGRPVPGIVVVSRLDENGAHTTTQSDGTFEIDGDSRQFDVATPGWCALRQGRMTGVQASTALVVVARTREIDGIVVDDAHAPIAGAKITVEPSERAFAAFPYPLDGTRPVLPHDIESADDGRFAQLAVPDVDGTQLLAEKTGFERGETDATLPLPPAVVITLKRAVENGWTVRGIVVLADGAAARDADVRLEFVESHSDEQGRFELHGKNAVDESAPLAAVKRGHQGALVENFGARIAAAKAPIENVRLQLGGPPLSIRGQVVLASGIPAGKWRISLHDGSSLVRNMVPPETLESLSTNTAAQVESDADGRFEISGLLARDYVLQAFAETSLVSVLSNPIPAGAHDARILVPVDATWPIVRGHVVDRDGRGMPDANVSLRVVGFRSGGATSYESSDPKKTDASGAFEFKDVPRRESSLNITGDGLIDAEYSFENYDGTSPLTITVARRAHFRVEGEPADAGVASFEMHDGRGQALTVYRYETGGWSASTHWGIEISGSAPLAVSEDATSIVFFDKSGQILHESSVKLVPGQVTAVRW